MQSKSEKSFLNSSKTAQHGVPTLSKYLLATFVIRVDIYFFGKQLKPIETTSSYFFFSIFVISIISKIILCFIIKHECEIIRCQIIGLYNKINFLFRCMCTNLCIFYN